MAKKAVATNANKNTKNTSPNADTVTMNGRKVSTEEVKKAIKIKNKLGNAMISTVVSDYCDSLVEIVETSK